MRYAISSKKFQVDAGQKRIHANRSELPSFDYPEVFGIKSTKTGKTEFFCFVGSRFDFQNNSVGVYTPMTISANLEGWSVWIKA